MTSQNNNTYPSFLEHHDATSVYKLEGILHNRMPSLPYCYSMLELRGLAGPRTLGMSNCYPQRNSKPPYFTGLLVFFYEDERIPSQILGNSLQNTHTLENCSKLWHAYIFLTHSFLLFEWQTKCTTFCCIFGPLDSSLSSVDSESYATA